MVKVCPFIFRILLICLFSVFSFAEAPAKDPSLLLEIDDPEPEPVVAAPVQPVLPIPIVPPLQVNSAPNDAKTTESAKSNAITSPPIVEAIKPFEPNAPILAADLSKVAEPASPVEQTPVSKIAEPAKSVEEAKPFEPTKIAEPHSVISPAQSLVQVESKASIHSSFPLLPPIISPQIPTTKSELPQRNSPVVAPVEAPILQTNLDLQPPLSVAKQSIPIYPGPFSPVFLEALEQQRRANAPIPVNLSRIPIALDKSGQGSSETPGEFNSSLIDSPIETPTGPEVSIIFTHNQFVPSVVKIRSGIKTKFFFTSVEKRPSAVVIERLTVQRWIAQHDSQFGEAPVRERPGLENEITSREINSKKMTEIILDPKPGKYRFHDPLSGARGEIVVE